MTSRGLSGSFSYAKNKMLEIFETAATYNNPNRRRTDQPPGNQFGYRWVIAEEVMNPVPQSVIDQNNKIIQNPGY